MCINGDLYLLWSQFKGYEVDKIAACTLLLEGTAAVSLSDTIS